MISRLILFAAFWTFLAGREPALLAGPPVSQGSRPASDRTFLNIVREDKESRQLGPYRLNLVKSYNADGAMIRLLITYSPYRFYWNQAFTDSRYVRNSDPLGPRPDWEVFRLDQENAWEWESARDLTFAAAYRAELTPFRFDPWDRLRLLDWAVKEYLKMYTFPEFLARSRVYFARTVGNYERQNPRKVKLSQGHAPVSESRSKETREYRIFKELLAPDGNFFTPSSRYDPTIASYFSRPDFLSRLPREIPRQVNVQEPLTRPVLLVVHASTAFDEDKTAARGIDEKIKAFKARKLPVIYLMEPCYESDWFWYPKDRNPDYAVYSAGGEHNLPLATGDVTIVGGFFGDYDCHHGCHFKALADSISRHFLRTKTSLNIHLPFNAIYFFDQDTRDREGFLNRTTTDQAFVDTVHHSYLCYDPGDRLGCNSGYYTGEITLRDYTFNYHVEGRFIASFGKGARKVNFHLSRD